MIDEQQQQRAAVVMIATIGVVIEESIRVRDQLTALGFREDQLLAVLEAAEVIELREKPLAVPQEHRDGLSYLRWGSVDQAMARQNLAYLVTERSDGQLNYRSIAKALVGGYTGCVELRFRESAVATLTDDSIVEIQVCLAHRQAA